MGSLSRLCLLLVMVSLLVTLTHAYDACQSDGPTLSDQHGRPIWIDTDSLVKSATHCIAPSLPPLARWARIEGHVLLDIVVDQEGKVACIEVEDGHPLLAPSALEAARQWTFRPRKQNGKAVSFYGHLRFHFSTASVSEKEDACTVVHS